MATISFIKSMTQRTKALFATAGALLVYGICCRLIGIYFFWDSLAIGFCLAMIGAFFLIFERYQVKKNENKETMGHILGMAGLSFLLIFTLIFSFSLKFFSDAYRVATEYVMTDGELRKELGDINGFGLVIFGSIETQSVTSGGTTTESGSAQLQFTAEGEKKFKDITVYLSKNPETGNWEVFKTD